MSQRFALILLLCNLSIPAVFADGDSEADRILEYRQSAMFLVGANFGPIYEMANGKIDWDDAAFSRYAADLAAVTGLNIERGFPPGSDGGHTRARPEIWEQPEEFAQLLGDLRQAARALAPVAAGGDRDAKLAAFKEVGKACKSCHDKFKSKDFRN